MKHADPLGHQIHLFTNSLFYLKKFSFWSVDESTTGIIPAMSVERGEISSPNYPNSYSSHELKNWIITVAVEYKVSWQQMKLLCVRCPLCKRSVRLSVGTITFEAELKMSRNFAASSLTDKQTQVLK